jgi:hypothetical protein
MVESGAIDAFGGNQVVFNAAYKVAEFDFIMQ